ncbi:MAG: hypothetical protein PVJ39_07145 [Gammaproteobacteria bacterium]
MSRISITELLFLSVVFLLVYSETSSGAELSWSVKSASISQHHIKD